MAIAFACIVFPFLCANDAVWCVGHCRCRAWADGNTEPCSSNEVFLRSVRALVARNVRIGVANLRRCRFALQH